MIHLPSPESSEQLLRLCVETLAFDIGERCSSRLEALEAATRFVESRLRAVGLPTHRQTYVARGRPMHLVEAEIAGRSPERGTLIVLAHTDAALIFPPEGEGVLGAAALLALAETVTARGLVPTVRFVVAVEQELASRRPSRPGIEAYAQRCSARGDDLRLVLALQGLGRGPGPLTFLGGLSAWRTARKVARTFESVTRLRARWWAGPGPMTGLGCAGHGAFDRAGFPALTVTGTGPLRPALPDQIRRTDYPSLLVHVQGLLETIEAVDA